MVVKECVFTVAISITDITFGRWRADEMQAEHMCQFLTDANCTLLILKFFNQEPWAFLTLSTGATIDKYAAIAVEVGSRIPSAPRDMFS